MFPNRSRKRWIDIFASYARVDADGSKCNDSAYGNACSIHPSLQNKYLVTSTILRKGF